MILRVMGEDPEVKPGDDPHNVFRFVHEVTPAGLQAQLQDAQAGEFHWGPQKCWGGQCQKRKALVRLRGDTVFVRTPSV